MRSEHPMQPPTDWGQAPEAPTHLPLDAFDLDLGTGHSQSASSTKKQSAQQDLGAVQAPKQVSRSRSDSVVTSAPRPSRHAVPAKAEQPSRSARGSEPRPLPQPPVAGELKVEPQPQPQPQAPAPAFMQFAGGAAFDPLAVPLPPELAPSVFGWVRRLALQADLASADRLLRDAIAELTSSLSVIIIYAGPDGFYSLGPDGELPKDLQPVLAVGKARRALVGPHSGLIPISTSTDTVAVIQLVRNVRQPAFGAADHITMAAIARESASVLHHLVVGHLQQRHESANDKKSLYRPEALEHHRKKGTEGVVADLSPKWIKRAYPILIATLLVAFAGGILLRVPTYSSGAGIVVYTGTPVTSQANGNLDQLFVERGQLVRAGDPVAKLSSQQQDADYAQAKAEFENAETSYLQDDQDDQARKTVKTAQIALTHAQAALDQRIIRSPADGKVSDIHGSIGELVQAGSQLMTIIKPGTKPEVWAYLPASDRPRIKMSMPLQVGVDGFNKKRAKLQIKSISDDSVGAAEIRRSVGQQLADTLKLPNDGASYILVKAEFESDSITVGRKTYALHHGMSTKAEIAIETKPFLASIFPLFEKYFD